MTNELFGQLLSSSQVTVIGISFWLFIAIVVVASLAYYHARNKDIQRTIRLAIEKGVTLDAALVDKLMSQKPGNPRDYYVGGIICMATGAGLPVMGYFIGKIAIEAFYPITGAGILLMIISLGLLGAGFLMKRGNGSDRSRDI